MKRLAAETTVVYLEATLETVDYRISLAPDRGIASGKDQTLADIYRERIPLYQRWAEISVSVDTNSPETIVSDILKKLP
jgi:shikimate kinase